MNGVSKLGTCVLRYLPASESVIDALTGSQSGSITRFCVRTKKLLVTDTATIETDKNGNVSEC